VLEQSHNQECWFDYGGERIGFLIRCTSAASQRLAIHVHPDGAVVVDVAQGTAIKVVLAAVRRRARWIWQQRAECRAATPAPECNYVSGEPSLYLGQPYWLDVSIDPDGEEGILLTGGRMQLYTRSALQAHIRTLLERWYRQRAQQVIERRLALCAAQLDWLPSPPAFRLRRMRARWGSCSPKGQLIFNPHLVKAPSQCIDYVIFHELCHFQVHNHSPQYYQLLRHILPDWQQRKQTLDNLAHSLLAL
jgi:predicted metal-dependent hydrolase